MTSLWKSAAELDREECVRLLRTVRIGRVGTCSPRGPQILPVNFTVLDGSLYFRTTLYSALAERTQSGTVAFEADELDDRLRSGWSVLVVGEAGQIEDPKEIRDIFGRMGEPWAPGNRPLIVRIDPTEVTGRRFDRA